MTSSSFSQRPVTKRQAIDTIRQYTEEEILSAASAVSFDDNGNPCPFKIKEVRREVLKNAGECRRYTISDQRASTLTGAKVSSVLRSHPELFQVIYKTSQEVFAFFPVNSSTTRGAL